MSSAQAVMVALVLLVWSPIYGLGVTVLLYHLRFPPVQHWRLAHWLFMIGLVLLGFALDAVIVWLAWRLFGA